MKTYRTTRTDSGTISIRQIDQADGSTLFDIMAGDYDNQVTLVGTYSKEAADLAFDAIVASIRCAEC